MTSGGDMKVVVATLSSSAAEVAMALLRERNRQLSNKRELRFGREVSLAMVTGTAKAGCWYDHENGIGCDPIDLIEHERDYGARHALLIGAVCDLPFRCQQ